MSAVVTNDLFVVGNKLNDVKAVVGRRDGFREQDGFAGALDRLHRSPSLVCYTDSQRVIRLMLNVLEVLSYTDVASSLDDLLRELQRATDITLFPVDMPDAETIAQYLGSSMAGLSTERHGLVLEFCD